MNKLLPVLACVFLAFFPRAALPASSTVPINFGSVPVGSSSSPLDILGNGMFSGSGCTVSWNSSPITGPNAGDFVPTGCQQQYNSAGQLCLVPVEFKPSTVGQESASVTVSLTISGCTGVPNGTAYTLAFNLSGTGTGGLSSGTFDPNSGVPSTLPPVVQSVTPSGTASSLSLSTRMKFDPSIYGQQGSIFVGAHLSPYASASALISPATVAMQEVRTGVSAKDATANPWAIETGTTWSPLGTSIPADFTGTLSDTNGVVNILSNANTAGLCGTDFYVGYGTSAVSMLANNTLGKVYTVMCNFSFTATNSGTSASLSLTANVQVATVDAGRNGSIYVGRLQNGQWFLYNGSAWVSYTGGSIPPYFTGSLATTQIPLYNAQNVQSMSGAQIFAGYGFDQNDMLNNQKYGLVFTVQ